jgi:monofunctional biosynthetic peptidoglycan transglycosylase
MPFFLRLLRRSLPLLKAALLVLVFGPVILLVLYRVVPPPITPLMVIRLFEGEGINKEWTPLEEMQPSLPKLVIAAEDNTFCSHWGFDLEAYQAQLEKSLKGRTSRGASTLSMQLAKNLFLWPGRSYVRKALEIPLTLYVELVLPKRRIMELYLNVVEFGPGIYGAEAAARAHFNISADKLSLQQAAQLAAVLPNPRRWSASKPTGYIQNRASLYRQRVEQLGPDYVACITP